MKRFLLSLVILTCALVTTSEAQWQCLYATWDDPDSNGTGHNTPSFGIIHENMFVALVMTRGTRCFMIPYVNADSALGRVYSYGYGGTTTDIYQVWTDGAFDQIQMFNVFTIAASSDSLIYVANNNNPNINNDPGHNILVFKYVNDTITVVPPYPRTATGSNGIYGITLDASKRVYVCNDTTSGQTQDVKIYNPVSQWTGSQNETPIRTIDLPDGIYKGIAVSPDGGNIFISDFANRKVLKYSGSAASGYTLNTAFNFTLTDVFDASYARPLGLGYLGPNNILAVACDSLYGGGASYSYGRIYFLNANTGALISADTNQNKVDQASWNFALTGGYNLRTDGKIPGNASGYTSTYDVKFDQNGNLYSQSNYGWTVEKWRYNGTLPSFTSVEEVGGRIPESYQLGQNYPNPFNPTTSIAFTVPASGFVSLKVYDLLGREIATLLSEEKTAGNYRATFDARNLPSGTYFYTLRAGQFSETKKMLLMK